MFACFRLGGVGADELPVRPRARLPISGRSQRRLGDDLPQRFPEHAARHEPPLRTSGSSSRSGTGLRRRLRRLGRPPSRRQAPAVGSSSTTIRAGSSSPPAPPASQGRRAHPRADGVRDHEPPLRPDAGHDDRRCLAGRAPLSHGAGIHQLAQGGARGENGPAASDRFDIDEAWRLVERWRITNMFTVPTIVKMLTEHPRWTRTTTPRCAT